jgi:hypothetical protein
MVRVGHGVGRTEVHVPFHGIAGPTFLCSFRRLTRRWWCRDVLLGRVGRVTYVYVDVANPSVSDER